MANRYWVASFAGTWNDTFNWSTTSGGIGGASVPGASDRVIFDSNGSGDCNITSTARSYGFDTTNYTGTIDVQSGITWQADSPQGGGLITIGQNATVTGSGEITSQGAAVTPTGTFDVATFTITRSQNLNPGTYGNANFNFHPGATRSLTLNAGDYIFEGDVSVGSTANATWKNSSHNPNITFKGNVSLDATYGLWSAGDGTIIFDNSGSQSVDFNGQTVEGIHVTDASTGSIVLASDFSTAWLRDCDSLIDLNGYTITNADSVDRCAYPYDPPTTIALDSSAAINADLEGWWPLTETDHFASGAADISGNGNNGTQVGGVLSDFGELGTVANFDGSNDYIDTGSSSIVTSFPVTVSAWVKPTSGVRNTIFGSYYAVGTDRSLHCEIDTAGRMFMLCSSNGSYQSTNRVIGTTTLSTSEYSHVVFVFEASGGSLYLNGVSESSSGSLFSTLSTPSVDFLIGTNGVTGNLANQFKGDISNVRVWSRSLSSSEVADLFSDPWIGSDYTAVVPPSNRFFSPAAFARLG